MWVTHEHMFLDIVFIICLFSTYFTLEYPVLFVVGLNMSFQLPLPSKPAPTLVAGPWFVQVQSLQKTKHTGFNVIFINLQDYKVIYKVIQFKMTSSI